MFVVLAAAPVRPDAWVRAARAVGLSDVDLRMRAQGPLPKVIHADADPTRAARLRDALRAEGARSFLLDPALVGQQPRIHARSLRWTDEGFTALDRLGAPHECPFVAIRLVQKGRVVVTESNEVTRSERSFAMGRAVLSGGLLLTKKVEKTEMETRERRSAMLLVQRHDGAEIALSEGQVDFRFLGPDMTQTSLVNLDRTLAALRARHPGLAVDERAFHQAFLLGVPRTGTDPVELAFALVAAATAEAISVGAAPPGS